MWGCTRKDGDIMEENEKNEQGTDFEETKSWLKDNLRIIISIIIVVAIAGGVYSYSKRSQESTNGKKMAQEQNEEGSVEIQKGEEEKNISTENNETATEKKSVISAGSSQETDSSFIETAGKGDGKTHLARRALANYLEKNPDSGLTAEHKIYIEDYLQKNVGNKGGIRVGTSIEFSKDSVMKAIESSKTLNDKQLNNLHKYAVRVPSLS